MSSIKLKHSGGNSVSISAPSSNPASDKTITLPNDESGQIITSDRSGTTLQRQFKYLTSNTQLAKGGAIGELNSDLRIDFTPKAADSNLLFEFMAPFVFPNSTHLQYAKFYDVTNNQTVAEPRDVSRKKAEEHDNLETQKDESDLDIDDAVQLFK